MRQSDRGKRPNPLGQEFKPVLVIMLALFCGSLNNRTWSPCSYNGTELFIMNGLLIFLVFGPLIYASSLPYKGI